MPLQRHHLRQMLKSHCADSFSRRRIRRCRHDRHCCRIPQYHSLPGSEHRCWTAERLPCGPGRTPTRRPELSIRRICQAQNRDMQGCVHIIHRGYACMKRGAERKKTTVGSRAVSKRQDCCWSASDGHEPAHASLSGSAKSQLPCEPLGFTSGRAGQ